MNAAFIVAPIFLCLVVVVLSFQQQCKDSTYILYLKEITTENMYVIKHV